MFLEPITRLVRNTSHWTICDVQNIFYMPFRLIFFNKYHINVTPQQNAGKTQSFNSSMAKVTDMHQC